MVKTILVVIAMILLVCGVYVRALYKKAKWIDGTDLTSRKQSRIEAFVALSCFAAGLGLLYAYTII